MRQIFLQNRLNALEQLSENTIGYKSQNEIEREEEMGYWDRGDVIEKWIGVDWRGLERNETWANNCELSCKPKNF